MEDEKIKHLFETYKPALTPGVRFINKLQQNLNSVEIIVRHNAEVRSKNKKAVSIAAIVGFAVGFLFSLYIPYLTGIVAEWQLTLPGDSLMNAFADNFAIIVWSVMGVTSVIFALNAYEISRFLLKPSARC